jgi:hypothetical protein
MRSLLLAAIALSVAACRVTPTPPGGDASNSQIPARVVLGQPFDLAVGASAQIPGGPKVTFVRVSEDSRCPSAAVCVWAGDAAVELRFESAQGGSGTTLHTGIEPKSIAYDAQTTIALVGVQPYPVQGGDIPADEYVATLEVTRP